MKKHHATVVLAIIFCTGLIVVIWSDPTGVDRGELEAVIPALSKVAAGDIKRLEVLGAGPDSKREAASAAATAGPRIVVERRDEGRWQMLEPFNTAAEPMLVESLAQNLKGLRRSPEAGTIRDAPKKYGLEPPAAVIRIFGPEAKTPLAVLEVGRAVRDQLYVRPEGGPGIEVVDPRLLGALKRPPGEWRDRALFHMPSFRVGALAVTGPGRDLKLERDEGHWHLVRPLRAVAEDNHAEGMVAELTALHVVAGDAGFVASDVQGKDAARYGLEPPVMTIAMSPALGRGKPQVLEVGNPESEQSERFYARAGGQDDVVLIQARNLRSLGIDSREFRSKKVADVNQARVEFLRIEAFGRTLDIARTARGWEQVRPVREPADATAVTDLLKALDEAQTSEFLDPAKVANPLLDPPRMTISVWQASGSARPALGLDAAPKAPPRVVLQVGRYDAVSKMVFARLEGDRLVLAIPESLDQALPHNLLAFRDRGLMAFSPTDVHRLTIHRGGTTYELAAPTEAGSSTHWRMLQPVAARADETAVTQLLVTLSSLRAEEYISDQVGDGRAFGLHAPVLTATWTTEPAAAQSAAVSKSKTREQASPAPAQAPAHTEAGSATTLRIGAKLPKKELWYANLEGSPIVFTLSGRTMALFEAEFHTHRVLSFAPPAARRVVLRWAEGKSLAFKPQENPAGKGVRWVPEPGSDAKGFDASRIGSLVTSLADLNTPRFLQYDGPIPATTGLDAPRLEIAVELSDSHPPRVLRIGQTSEKQAIATTATGASGPTFLLTGPAWHDLATHVPGADTLPPDVFAPETVKPAAGETGSKRP